MLDPSGSSQRRFRAASKSQDDFAAFYDEEILHSLTLPKTNMAVEGKAPISEDHEFHYKQVVPSTSMLVFGSVTEM